MLVQQMQETIDYIRHQTSIVPRLGFVLGSGLGQIGQGLRDAVWFNYQELPHFRQSTVVGHAGKLWLGYWCEVPVAIMQGRFHYYEGVPLAEVVYPIRVLHRLGLKALILTNAAGGINLKFKAGNLVLCTDHLNLMGANPLRGPNDEQLGPRFPDMSQTYDEDLQKLLILATKKARVTLKRGVYAAVAGPSYETPAEIKMLRRLGADMVGMSTVPEAIAARHLNLPTAAISCISNLGAGMKKVALSHEEVQQAGAKAALQISTICKKFIPLWREKFGIKLS